jgi:YegS/Rv2252/BmrU family lipid kinase
LNEPLLLVVNPYAGRASDLLPAVLRVLRALRVAHEVRYATGFEGFAALAADAADAGFRAVVAVGGDGTVNGVANGIMQAGSRIPMGIVPAGTANEFARALPIPRSVSKAAAVLAEGVAGEVDIARVNGRYFLNLFGFGFDARVAAGAHRLRDRVLLRGRAVYYLATLLEIAASREPLEVEVFTEQDAFRGRVLFVAGVNGRMYGERVPSLPSPSLRDGLLDLYVVRDMRRIRSFNVAMKMIRRTPIPEILIQRAREITLLAERPVEAHVDGNLLGTFTRVHARVVPRGIRVLFPPDALPWQEKSSGAEEALMRRG